MTDNEAEIRALKAAIAFRSAIMWSRNYAQATTPEYRAECNERITYWHKRYNSLVSLGHSEAVGQREYADVLYRGLDTDETMEIAPKSKRPRRRGR